jgi:hypothetical protein
MNCFALLFPYYDDYLTLSPFAVCEKATFFENNCKFLFVLKAALCLFACLFIVVIYILIVL